MNRVVAFGAGLLFAAGLGISGMTHPPKIIGFLDFFGAWDPSLLFVMIGALLAYSVFLRTLTGRAPVLAERYDVPGNVDIDGRLVVGAALFGIGWGMAGFCPGPALVSLASGIDKVFAFVAAMASGMLLFSLLSRRR